jgi:hypothetical protein
MHGIKKMPSNVKTPEEVNVDDLLNAPMGGGCFGKGGSYWDRPGRRSDPFASVMGAVNAPADEGQSWSSSASAAAGDSGLFDMWL